LLDIALTKPRIVASCICNEKRVKSFGTGNAGKADHRLINIHVAIHHREKKTYLKLAYSCQCRLRKAQYVIV